MRLNRLDLNLLVCLDALLAERNVSRAAARVFLSQPAMSVALRRLRAHFEDDLLVQSGRTYQPTPFATSLQKSVRDMVLSLRALSDLRPQFDPLECDRKLRIECSDYVCTVLMTRLCERACTEAPNMRFDLRLLGTGFLENLDSGEIDILVIPESLGSRDHPREVLFTDTFSCVVWQGNTRVAERVTREQYLALRHVVSEWDGGRMSALDEVQLLRAGYQRRRDITTPSFALTPQFVIGTQRIATVQTRLAEQMAARWPIRVLPCPVEMPPIVEIVQWHRHQECDDAIVWFLDLLRRVAGELRAAHSVRAQRPKGQKKRRRPTTAVRSARRRAPRAID